MKGYKNRQKGIGLIEVLIAAVVFALGSLAVVQLQGKFFKSSSASNARSVAMSIAQEKLEDLRGVASTTGGFVTIAANAGGRLCVAGVDLPDTGAPCNAGVLSRPTGNIAKNNALYTRTWTVANSYYDTAGALLSQANCTTSSICGPDNTSVPAIPDQKNITVTIAWTDTDGTAQTVVFDGLINANSTSSGGTILADTGGSGEKPIVPHTELAAPDVIPTKIKNPPPLDYPANSTDWDALTTQEKLDEYAKLGYCNVETFASTEAPDPDLDTNPQLDNTIVRFTSSKYQKYTPCLFNATNDYTIDNVNDIRTIKYDDDEFLTINCRCQLATSGIGQDQSGASVTKARTATKTGATNQQSDFCDLCCRDHHENTTGNNVCSTGDNPENCYDPFRILASNYSGSDHKHYSNVATSTVALTGDQYTEVCRIKRVDGFYNVFPDWKMIAHNTLVANELNDATEATSYQSYIGTSVNNYLSGTAATGWSATTPDVPTNGSQMMSRSIYVDYMTAAEIATASPSGDTVDARVPFYEYKTTLLASWKTTLADGTSPRYDVGSPCSPSGNGTCVDSPTIPNIVSNGTDKGIYRYGTVPTSDIKIVSTMTDSNSGVVNVSSVDPSDNITLASDYTITYGSAPPPVIREIKMSLASSLTCAPTLAGGYKNPSANVTNWSAIALSCSPSSGGASTCQGYSSDTSNITVTASLNTAVLGCGYTKANGDAASTSCSSISATTVATLNGASTCGVYLTSSSCSLVCLP